MDKELIHKLEKEIKYQQEQFDFLYGEHFIAERADDLFYGEMIIKINK